MKNLILSLLLISLIGCKSKQTTVSVKSTKQPTEQQHSPDTDKKKPKKTKASKKVSKVIKTAMDYSGTPYRYGGTTKRGMDCSGLIYVAFKENGIALERVSRSMAKQGKKIKLKQVQKGDLLFFTTSKNRRRINHVGLVVSVRGNDIQFIHATTSRGVLVSSLNEGYWNYAFNHARKIL